MAFLQSTHAPLTLQAARPLPRRLQDSAAGPVTAGAPRVLRAVGRAPHQAAVQRSGIVAAASASSGSVERNVGLATTADAVASEQPVMVKRYGKLVPVPPKLAPSLAPMAELCGGADAQALSKTVTQLDYVHQEQLEHCSPQVVAYLRGLGLEQPQLARLAERCPLLFSYPAQQRAGVLFGQLMGLGLSAAEAARCFTQQPGAAHSPSFEAAIEALSDPLASGSKEGQARRQLVGALLSKQPAAASLLMCRGSCLQERIAYFLGELGFSPQELTARLQQQWVLLKCTPEHLAALEAMLQRELGANRSLFRKILARATRVVGCSLATVQRRAQALVAVSEDVMRCIYHQLTWRELVCCRVASSDQPSCGLTLPCLQEFGWEQALRAVDMAPDLLAINTGVWRRALAVMHLCGVAAPAALALNNAHLLCLDWLAPGRLANRLALQRCLGLSPAGVFERHAGYVVKYAAERLAGRLLYLEQRGLLHLLVADKQLARQAWLQERGLPANKPATGKPAFISARDLAVITDDAFVSPLDLPNGAADVAAFKAGLLDSPAWQQLWEEAEAKSARLTALLPPELRPGSAAADMEVEGEEGWDSDDSAA